ncbi:MAG: hypothetical protein ACR2NW_06380 [Thermodesulfobacteriota bacterium]
MKNVKFILPLVISVCLLGTSCIFVAGAAAGGASAYILKEKGYKVQSPVAK